MEDNGTASYTNPRVQEQLLFENISTTAMPNVEMGLNHTDANRDVPEPDAAAYLNAAAGRIIGPAIALKVSPGDTVHMEVFGKYRMKAKRDVDRYSKRADKHLRHSGKRSSEDSERIFNRRADGHNTR